MGFFSDLCRYKDELESKNMICLDQFGDLSNSTCETKYVIAKALFSNNINVERADCIHLNLSKVWEFIDHRLSLYERKREDWTFFHSSLIQYKIWDIHMKGW